MYTKPTTKFNERMRALNALHENNLKHFIMPWLSFRLHISFKQTTKAFSQKKRHFYGNEHTCTLNQVLHGYRAYVELDRYKGLKDLIDLVEKTWAGKWSSATIYMRNAPGDQFNEVVRQYYQGELQEEQSPVLQEPVIKLFFHGMDGEQLPVFKTEPVKHEDLPDFKKLVADGLGSAG